MESMDRYINRRIDRQIEDSSQIFDSIYLRIRTSSKMIQSKLFTTQTRLKEEGFFLLLKILLFYYELARNKKESGRSTLDFYVQIPK